MAYQLMKDLTAVKQGKATANCSSLFREVPCRRMRDTELMDRILSELYNHEANGDPSVLNFSRQTQRMTNPILRKEVQAVVQLLKEGKSAGVGNIPAELVQAGGEEVIIAVMTICNKI